MAIGFLVERGYPVFLWPAGWLTGSADWMAWFTVDHWLFGWVAAASLADWRSWEGCSTLTNPSPTLRLSL